MRTAARRDPPERPASTRPALVPRGLALLVALCIGAAMSGLNGSIVNMALPVVTEALGTDIATAEWVVTSYLLVLSSLLLSFGRLGDILGHRPLYLGGLGIYVLGSGLCGLAPSIGFLIAARAFQALGAAMVSATSPAILTAAIPSTMRGRALGFFAMSVYLGLVVGPGLGGLLTELWGWRAVFYATVPVGLLALVLGMRSIPTDVAHRQHERFDWWGAVGFTVGLAALLLGLNQGHAWGWASPASAGCFVVALLAFGLFLGLEQRVASPMLDLGLFRNRLFSAAIATAVLNYMGAFALVFLMPFYLLQGRGLTPGETGLIISATPLAMVIAAPISGALSDRFGSRMLASGGMALLAAGLFLLSRLAVDTPMTAVVAALLIAGLGTGAFTSPNTNATLSAVSPARRGIASGVLGTARNLGMVLGIGLSGAALTTALAAAGGHASPAQLTQAVDTGFLFASGLALVGVFTAAARA